MTTTRRFEAAALLLLGVIAHAGRCLSAEPEFQIGADVSSLPQIESNGGVFKDHGQPAGLLAILKSHGINRIRLRIWNQPRDGVCGLEQTLAMARRLKQAGLPWLLDFHYADTWADPGHQPKPAGWANQHGVELENAVFTYTRDVIAALDLQATVPEMVQVGNEITAGFLWDDGKLGGKKAGAEQWPRFLGLLKSGIRGVREGRVGKPPIRIMIHIDRGGDNAGCRWFFDRLQQAGVDFDVIGLSYYPFWHGTLEQLQKNLDDLSTRYGRDLIVVETGYPSSPAGVDATWKSHNLDPTPQGQRTFLTELVKTVRETRAHRGAGIYYWEPAWIDTPSKGSEWRNRGLFDPNGELLDSIVGLTGK